MVFENIEKQNFLSSWHRKDLLQYRKLEQMLTPLMCRTDFIGCSHHPKGTSMLRKGRRWMAPFGRTSYLSMTEIAYGNYIYLSLWCNFFTIVSHNQILSRDSHLLYGFRLTLQEYRYQVLSWVPFRILVVYQSYRHRVYRDRGSVR